MNLLFVSVESPNRRQEVPPVVPALIVPLTSSLYAGEVVPIPTFPLSLNRTISLYEDPVPPLLKVNNPLFPPMLD